MAEGETAPEPQTMIVLEAIAPVSESNQRGDW
jgi:hypothetical protein